MDMDMDMDMDMERHKAIEQKQTAKRLLPQKRHK
jgi:hypothetical protein